MKKPRKFLSRYALTKQYENADRAPYRRTNRTTLLFRWSNSVSMILILSFAWMVKPSPGEKKKENQINSLFSPCLSILVFVSVAQNALNDVGYVGFAIGDIILGESSDPHTPLTTYLERCQR